jgi:hypothetical protein
MITAPRGMVKDDRRTPIPRARITAISQPNNCLKR